MERDIVLSINCLRDRYATQETKIGQDKMNQQLKRQEWDVVAARAGIQRAHTSQTPLTRRFVHNARAHEPLVIDPRRVASQAETNNKNAQARPVRHVTNPRT
jgi:hypothetical protein